MNNDNEILEIQNLNFSYEKEGFALKNINFSVQVGDFISVIGRNGSGKSTLIKTITGFINNFEGQISCNGKNIKEYSRKEFAKIASYLPQSAAFIESGLPVYDILLMGRYSYKSFFDFSYTPEDKRIVDESIKIAGIENLKNKELNKLSGGEKQKVLLTLCLVQLDITKNLSGKILIIDEPLAFLDAHFQLDTFSLLNKLNKKQNLTILMITHDLNFALKFTGKTLLMDNGEIVKFAKPENVLTKEIMKKYFLINSSIHMADNESFINYKIL
jgi:iron complex transport system ATP-binding protein